MVTVVAAGATVVVAFVETVDVVELQLLSGNGATADVVVVAVVVETVAVVALAFVVGKLEDL